MDELLITLGDVVAQQFYDRAARAKKKSQSDRYELYLDTADLLSEAVADLRDNQ